MNLRKRSGQILVFFLALTAIGLLLATSLLALQGNVYRAANRNSHEKEATYLAEAGIEKGFVSFKANASYTGETLSLGGGSVTVNIATGSTNNERILSAEATAGLVTKRLRAKLVTQANSTAVAFNYAMQAGTDGFSVGNNSTINGNVYSNSNITGGNNSIITGDAKAVGSITNITVGGQRLTGQPVQPLPPFDANFWRSKAQEGGTINGNHTPTTGSTLGPKYINGDLIFGNSVNVTISGPVYVTGTISFGNSPVLTEDNSLGSAGSMLVSEQALTLGNTITINNNTSGGYLLLVTTSTSGISIGNTATAINGPLYAPNGTLSVGNGAHAVAFTGKRIQTGNGAILDYDEGLADASFSTGPGGTWIFQKGSLQEY